MRWLDSITDIGHGLGWAPGVGDGQGGDGALQFLGSKQVRHD